MTDHTDMTEPPDAGPAGADHLGLTPSQTVGPFYGIGLPFPAGPYALAADAADTPDTIWVRGRVTDGAGEPVPDALIETWQSDPPVTDEFRAFARCSTDPDGRYAIRTRKPGPVPGPGGRTQAPHLAMSVFARGLLDRVVTRVYFGDEEEANRADQILGYVAEPEDRATLVAIAQEGGYVFDIRLQGEGETVFFAI